MNQKFHGTKMILLLVIGALFLSACGTVQVEQVEPAAAIPEQQVVMEEPEVDESLETAVLEEVVVETAVSATLSAGVSPTSLPVILTSTPTPFIEAIPAVNTVHNSGSDDVVVLPGCFDFDNGGTLAPPDPNCDFNLLPGPDSGSIEIYPIGSAQLAYGSVFPETPTYAQCANNDAFSAEPELVAPLAAMYVCYRTGENRVGYLHFTDADLEQAYTATLEWLTFSHEQDGGTVPEEMGLAYTNNTFGFTLPLPDTWHDYTVTQNEHEGVTNFCFTFVGSAPTCVLQIDVYSQGNWNTLEKVPNGYYLAENDLFVFASGPHQESCVQLDAFQCARYQEIPTILAGFTVE